MLKFWAASSCVHTSRLSISQVAKLLIGISKFQKNCWLDFLALFRSASKFPIPTSKLLFYCTVPVQKNIGKLPFFWQKFKCITLHSINDLFAPCRLTILPITESPAILHNNSIASVISSQPIFSLLAHSKYFQVRLFFVYPPRTITNLVISHLRREPL